ncbi:alpha-galactosidase [Arcanobacterium bovis]|uniref:alpha-galactosidase n=1 Tax=Arcanobacterium bovis TaxID=2529275 RepID=A0A4Q9V267_9ACTO|nr:alpha-galactosidase [Arcanobacterium bovis]TBW22230.1 alpha-galactosidase [Arcanobacterium bovis]
MFNASSPKADIVLRQAGNLADGCTPTPTSSSDTSHTPTTHTPASLAPTSLVLSIPDEGLPRITYWGSSLPSSFNTPLHLTSSQLPQLLGAGLDISEFPSLLPTQAEGWTGTPALLCSRSGVALFANFTTTEIEHTPSRATIVATDDVAQLSLRIHVEITTSGLVVQQATLRNTGSTPLDVQRLNLAFPIPSHARELLTFTGHHLRERAAQRQPFHQGRVAQESWVGRPDFSSGFLFTAGTPGFDAESGECFSVHTAWSGNVTHFAERTPYSLGLLGGGELLYPGEIVLGPNEEYGSPRVVGAWAHGLNDVSARFHSHLRDTNSRTRERITFNSWEAVYFDQNPAQMHKLAQTAAELGIERFVIDDGWFRGRRDDTRALGDWAVDRDVWPAGLEPFSKHVHELGMELGIWFEPEMISLNSDLARAHPEWIIAPNSERLPVAGRHEYVLDLSNPATYEHILQSIAAVVRDANIDYIKWDHNRFVTEAVSPFTGRPAVHTQTQALYRLLRQLRAEFPNLQIESCSSGGGRIDLAILELVDRVWASDCTDPIERSEIQRHTALIVPPERIGAHIANSPSHQTGRTLSLATRAAVAFAYGLGFELDITQLDTATLAEAKQWVERYKVWREVLAQGRAVHTDIVDPAQRVSGRVAVDQSRAVYCVVQRQTSPDYPSGLIRFPGLKSEAVYRVEALGAKDLTSRIAATDNYAHYWWIDGAQLPGNVLSEWGLRPPHLLPGEALLIALEQVG